MRSNNISTPIILLAIFILSILVRVPNINRPLSKHHEFVTAIALQIITIWQMEGAAKYHYNPVMNYPGAANKYIDKYASPTGKMVDKEGNYYYVSHPPLAYLLPYFVFKLFYIRADVLSIEIFHLAVNLITAFFIYLIICLLRNTRAFTKPDVAGVAGFSLYIFSTGVLWFQCNTYMSDMLVHVFFVMAVYFLLQIFKSAEQKTFFVTAYAVSLFLMIYTSWLGLFFAFSVLLWCIFYFKKFKSALIVSVITIIISIVAVGLFVRQYAMINGLYNYIDQMHNRLGVRSEWFRDISIYEKLKIILHESFQLVANYFTSYLLFILLLPCFFYLYKKKIFKLKFSFPIILFLWCSLFPVFLVHVFLLDYSGHDFVTLYASLFLSVGTGLLYGRLRNDAGKSVKFLQIIMICGIAVSVASYYFINEPGNVSWKGDQYSLSHDLGLQIKNTSTRDAVVFTMGNALIDPQLMYYAQRNVKEILSRQEAFDFLRKRNISHGFIYYSSRPEKTFFDKIEEIKTFNK